MFPNLFRVISSLLLIVTTINADDCNQSIINAVDSFLHSEHHRIKLPERKVLGMVTLKDGKVTALGNIDFDVVDTRRSSGDIVLKTAAVLRSLNATYSCSVRLGSCSKANVHITDLTADMNIKMEARTGKVRIVDITLNTGQYRLSGKLMGRPVNMKNVIPNNLKDSLAKFIRKLADQTRMQVEPENCMSKL